MAKFELPKYDETLELLKDASKILEMYTKASNRTPKQYSSDSLTSYSNYTDSSNNEELQFKEDSFEKNGTYVVSSETISPLATKSSGSFGKFVFPYVETFLERIESLKQKHHSKNFDAFWINWSDLKCDERIENQNIVYYNSLDFQNCVKDNFLYLFIPQRYCFLPDKQPLIIEEIFEEDHDKNEEIQIETIARNFVDSIINDAILHCSEKLIKQSINNQQVCLNQHLDSDKETLIVRDSTTSKTELNASKTFVSSHMVVDNEFGLNDNNTRAQSKRDEENYAMPLEFKLLLEDIKQSKLKTRRTSKGEINSDDTRFDFNARLIKPCHTLTLTKTKDLNHGGPALKINENVIITEEFKEVTDGCGVTVGAEERFVDTERVGSSNNVSIHRDGSEQSRQTINIQSDDSVDVDVCDARLFSNKKTSKFSEPLVEIRINNNYSPIVKVFVDNEYERCKLKMRDFDELTSKISEENFVKNVVDTRKSVKCEKTAVNGCSVSICDDASLTMCQNNNDSINVRGKNVSGNNGINSTPKSPNNNETCYKNSDESVKPSLQNHHVSFEKVNGGENLQIYRAPVRKLMSRSRKCVRAGNRRDARRRVASIRRSDVTPQPSLKKPSSCAGCLLLRVAPSGPFLLLDLSTTESKSEKTFTNKLLSIGQVCPCNQNYTSKFIERQKGDTTEKETSTDSLQVINTDAEKSVTNQESETTSLTSPFDTFYGKEIPVSVINFKNKSSAKSDFKNNLLLSSDCLRVHSCGNSVTNKLSDKAVCEDKDNLSNGLNNTEQYLNKLLNGCIKKDKIIDKEKNLNTSSSVLKDNNTTLSNDNKTTSLKLDENQTDSIDFLTSKILNSFEVSSRLKRLEGKLRSSLESLKDASIKDIDDDKSVDVTTNNTSQDNINFVESLPAENLDRSTEKSYDSSPKKEQIDVYSDSIKNNLEEFLKIHRDLRIKEFCTENSETDAISCPTKNLLESTKEQEIINELNHNRENSFEFSTDVDSDLTSDAETKELEEFERQERWASNEEYFSVNASIFASSACQFSVTDATNINFGFNHQLKCYDELLDSSESLSSADEETVANTLANSIMRGEGPAADRRHNKDASNLKSLLKKTTRKGKKNRVIFNENKNEFFEADYIILIREECQYDEDNDEGVCTCNQHEMVRLSCCEGDCNGCEQDDCNTEGDPVTLSPPEGYKDGGMFHKDGTIKEQGLFNKDGTLRDQGLFAHPSGLLVGESSGTVFSPQHLHQLQLIQRLQREQLRRAKAALGAQDAPTDPPDEGLEDRVEDDDPEEEITLLHPKITYAKEIVAGEERPKVNSGQQTTPTDEVPNEDSRCEQISTHQSSPMRLGGILKGGRLWKASMDGTLQNDQTEDSSNFKDSASDEEGRVNRAVRFSEPSPSQCGSSSIEDPSESQDLTDSSNPKPELTLFRIGSHLLSNNTLRPNSAVRQLFPAGPQYITTQRTDSDKQYLVTSESLRAFEEGKRSSLPTNCRDEDSTVRRTIDRNTLRRSLVKVDVKKKVAQKNDTSLSERIKMLTCNIDDEDTTPDSNNGTERCSPSTEETLAPVQLPTKCFSPSSSSSSASSCSSTSSTYKKLTDIFPKRQERIPECNEEGNGVVIIPQSDKIIGSNLSQNKQTFIQESKEYTANEINSQDQPAPDVLAGTPGASDGDELARFVQQESARTERLRKKYNQQTSTENSDDDDQDDYGFSDRPTVRGIKPHFGSTNEILQQMQTQLMPQQVPTTRPGHISWPYYSESNLTMPVPHEHTLHHNMEQSTNRQMDDYHQQAAIRMRERMAMQGQRDIHNIRHHEQQHENIYQNCMTYVNLRCNGNERDMYTGQPHMEHMHTFARQHRRPESPPPIRSYHQTMVLLPYSNLPRQPHYSNTVSENTYHNLPADQNNLNEYPTLSYPKQKNQIVHMKQGQQTINIPYQGIPMQLKCSAPMAHIRTVQPRPLAQQMICYSEKVKAPLYQAAPGSPGVTTTMSGNIRGVPEGAPAPAASPTVPQNQPHQHNSLYYAMNV